MKKKLGDRIISLILSFNLVFNNLAPFVSLVKAQEVTPNPTATQEVTVAPTENPTPTEEITPTPAEEVSPTVEPTQDVTPTSTVGVSPTIEVTPTVEVSPTVESTLEPTEATSVPSPPEDGLINQTPTTTPEISIEPSSEPSPTITPLMTPNAHVDTQVVETYSCRTDSLNGCLMTDKPDYAPTEVAIITGYGFIPNTSYTLRVYSTDEPPVDNSYQITTDANGSFTYSYQLDGTYRPNYTVELKDTAGFAVASVTFTDSPTKITAKTHQGQNSDNTWTSGNVTQYSEGDSINFRFELEATHGPSNGQLEVRFTGDDGSCLFFDNAFSLGTVESLSGGPTPSVSVLSGPTATDFGTSSGEWVVALDIDYNSTFDHPAGSARVNYTLTLSDEAGQCNGSSQHSRLNPAGGVVEQSGQQNVPVPANQVIEYPEITVIKQIDRDGDGTFESVANAGEYCFTLDGGSCTSTDSSGQVVFTNVTPDGGHTITETQLDTSIGTYEFVSGSGTNCTFSDSTSNGVFWNNSNKRKLYV